MMGMCVRIAAVAIIISRCLAGCSFAAPLQDGPRPEDDFTVSAGTSADSTVEPTAIPAETTVPTCGETEPIQTVIQPEPDDGDFVMVAMYIPDIVVELRYSTMDNFTNQQIYSFTDGWLRYGTVKKLMSVQKELGQNGYSLKLWDGFRPPSAQYRLWEVCPDPVYVANPNNGFSSHSRGNTVDITLVHMDGTEAVMPTDFDDFSGLADRNYSDCGKEAADNALYLEQVMIKHMPNTRIDGQLAPFTFMRNVEDDIIAEVKRDCEAAKIGDLRGLNLATAGSINNGSLLESMRVVMAAIQNFGRY